MIHPTCPTFFYLFLLIQTLSLPSLASARMRSLTIDHHPCAPEKMKAQNRYICNSVGKIRCLTGWTERAINPDPNFPCPLPVCQPQCQHGQCQLPNVCSCEIGWEGPDCGTCMALPGCANGNCINPNTGQAEPFTCHCKPSWDGALCDIPKCVNNCHNNGICAATGGEENSCRCNVGWQGDECEECLPLEGCVMENTESGSGCYQGETPVPSSCQCKEEWSGTHCDQPKCLSSQDGSELKCVQGDCVKVGKDSNGDQLSHFCQCKVGWKGENCDECEPAYECPTAKNETGAGIRACHLPGQCRCAGIRQEDNDEQHKRCTIWISDVCGDGHYTCKNSGTCNDGICQCAKGFSGHICEIDACDSIECQNSGTCSAGECICSKGFSGDHCEKDMCDSIDCQNSGTCTEGECECADGFSGELCETDLCELKSCLNSGTCSAGKCVCAEGFSGNLCQNVLCDGLECENFATCNAGECQCVSGFSGDQCEIAPVSPGWNKTENTWVDQCPNLESVEEQTAAECVELCRENSKCTAVIYSSDLESCQLLQCEFPVPVPQTSQPGYVGYYQVCAEGFRLVPGDIPGNGQVDLRSTGERSISDVSDTAACAELCIATDGVPFFTQQGLSGHKFPCKSYEYSASEKICNLNRASVPTRDAVRDYAFCVTEPVTTTTTFPSDTNAIFIAGGHTSGRGPPIATAEVFSLTNSLQNPSVANGQRCSIPDIPQGYFRENIKHQGNQGLALALTKDSSGKYRVLSCSGTEGHENYRCYWFDPEAGKWHDHSLLVQPNGIAGGPANAHPQGLQARTMSMEDGVYLLGEERHNFNYFKLPHGTNNWVQGPPPPEGAYYFRACAAKISPFEFILIGGFGPINPPPRLNQKTVHKYNVRTKQWTKLPDLIRGRASLACTFYPDTNKPYVIVSGGKTNKKEGENTDLLSSTELVFVDGSGTVEAGPLNVEKGGADGVLHHGLVTVDLPNNPIPKVFAVGGQWARYSFRDQVEEWEPLTKTWKITEMKLHSRMYVFGFLAVNFDLVCPK